MLNISTLQMAYSRESNLVKHTLPCWDGIPFTYNSSNWVFRTAVVNLAE